jgi:hypothetical protein
MTKKIQVETAAKIRQEKAKAKENELFAILGRYVQEFESVVTTLRNDCRDIVIGEERGVALNRGGGLEELAHKNICSLAFHHEVMTARPIAELWCGLIYEQTRADQSLTQETREVIFGVSKTITGDFKKLIETRNRLLHASWNIGPWYKPENLTFQFSVKKFRSGQKGFETRGDLPRNPDELVECALEVTSLKIRVSNFNSLRRYSPGQLVTAYERAKDRWETPKATHA